MRILLSIILVLCIVLLGQVSIRPSLEETKTIIGSFGIRKINSFKELQKLQSDVLKTVQHDNSSNSGRKIDILVNLKEKRGLCYEKSLLLQKALFIYGIQTRPIFIFNANSGWAFFNEKGNSDAALEAKIDGRWCFVPTSYSYDDFLTKTDTLFSLNELLGSHRNMIKNNTFFMPEKLHYMTYLFDRNSRLFGSPYWPDYRFF